MSSFTRRSFIKSLTLTTVALISGKVFSAALNGFSIYGNNGYGGNYGSFGSYGNYGQFNSYGGYGNYGGYGYGSNNQYGYLCDADGSNCEYLPLEEIMKQNGSNLIEGLTNQ